MDARESRETFNCRKAFIKRNAPPMNVEIEIQDLKQLLAELILSQKETDAKFKETDRVLSEKFTETDRVLSEKFRETDRRINQAFDLFESQWGKLMESLVEGDLVRILSQRGIEVTNTTTRRRGYKDGEEFEFDIIAHDTTEICIVEVKTTLRVKDIKKFLGKMKKAKRWLHEYKDYRVLGAVAFLRAEEDTETMAENKGLFVIRATGDSAAIVNREEFVPKAF
jgi:Holliday junction resolvase-like predicted endonuclease